MKYLVYLIIIAAVIALVGVCACCGRKLLPSTDKPLPEGALMRYIYYEYGSMAQPDHSFEITANGDSATATLVVKGAADLVYEDRVLDGETLEDYDRRLSGIFEAGDTVVVPLSVMEQVRQLIVEHKMQNYDDHYQPAFEVMDGTQWTYEARFGDDKSLHSSGSNARPDDDGLEQINALLRDTYRSRK